MDIRDRGNMKWTSIILPEQRRMLNQLYKKQNHQPKPQLAEHQWEELNWRIGEALETKEPLTLTIYSNNTRQTLQGTVMGWQKNNRKLSIFANQAVHSIAIDDIIDVK